MLDELFLPLFEQILGRSLPHALEDMTGVSAKTWRTSGGPKRPRAQQKVQENLHKWGLAKLMDTGGYSPEEAKKIADLRLAQFGKAGFFTSLAQGFNSPENFEWPQTEALGQQLDDDTEVIRRLYIAKDLQGLQTCLLAFCEQGPSTTWLLTLKGFDEALEEAKQATCWGGLIKLLAFWSAQSVYRFLASWDVEFHAVYLTDKASGRGMRPQPLFGLLLPTLRPGVKPGSDGKYPSRGLFHPPLRRLLELSFRLAHFHRYHQWPKTKDARRRDVAAWGGSTLLGTETTEQPLAKIYRGSRSLSAEEFLDVWVSMCGEDKDGISPMPPWPCYIAAQIWTHLFVETMSSKKYAGIRSMITQGPEVYSYWWTYYFEQFKAKDVRFGDMPWPSYLVTA